VLRYLKRSSLEMEGKGDRIRVLMKLRCGNLEDWNKFWIEEDRRKCKFCGKGRDNMEHYIENCGMIKDWFRGLVVRKYGIKCEVRI